MLHAVFPFPALRFMGWLQVGRAMPPAPVTYALSLSGDGWLGSLRVGGHEMERPRTMAPESRPVSRTTAAPVQADRSAKPRSTVS